jgi:membrane protein HdeD
MRSLLLRFMALCFAIAALGHFRAILLHGWLPYRFAPQPINAFWTALAFLDLLAACLLLWRPRVGLAAGLLIRAADVTVNFYATRLLGSGGWLLDAMRQSQSLFLGFLLGSLPFTWSHSTFAHDKS